MCSPMTMTAMKAGGTMLGGLGDMRAGNLEASQLRTEAAGEVDAAQQQAERILRATRKERGAARAALAASGTKLDEFALINEEDIQLRGEMDAAMATLTGSRRAASLQTKASLKASAGRNAFLGSLISGGSSLYDGWKGAKEPADYGAMDELYHSNRSLGD
jgi:hypothetical protein